MYIKAGTNANTPGTSSMEADATEALRKITIHIANGVIGLIQLTILPYN